MDENTDIYGLKDILDRLKEFKLEDIVNNNSEASKIMSFLSNNIEYVTDWKSKYYDK
jgi:hypothetical protein